MIGMTLKVEMLNGETHEAPVTYGVASRWEDQHPQTSVSKFLEDMKFKQLAWLAWDALRTKKITVKVFPQFLDEVGELGIDEQALLLRALESKRFPPFGGDQDVSSDFQLIAGTNRDLHLRVREGLFREDLLARLNLWTFRLPGLRDRPEDLEPNLDYELEQYVRRHGTRVTLSTEARDRFLTFAQSSEARWSANFRDLNAAVTRMATLAEGGRITRKFVDEESARLRAAWAGLGTESDGGSAPDPLLGSERWAAIDPFDRVQLAEVIRVCRESKSQSEAGRRLFSVSRLARKHANDADRLSKYLARFGLSWKDCSESTP